MALERVRVRARWAVALATLGLVGCYTYVPAPTGVAPRGTTVQATLRGDPELDVGDYRVRDAVQVRGEVIDWKGDSLALSAKSLVDQSGRSFPGNGYTVKLALADVTGVAVKRLDKTRTALLVVGAVAAAFLGERALGGGFSSSGSGSVNGGSAK